MNVFKNLEEVDIKKICEKVVNEASVNEDYDNLKITALKMALDMDSKTNTKGAKGVKKELASGIVALYNKAMKDKIHPYELLKKHGYIKDPFEEFLNVE